MDWLLVAQALNLIGCNLYYCTRVVLALPSLLVFYLGLRRGEDADDPVSAVTFYEGMVLHIRQKPVVNKFRYAVRMAVLDLDAPPSWFKRQAGEHMTADEARKFACTSGPVKLLTDPMSAGYVQNPISVYYCYGSARAGEGKAALEQCIAEVTNTPWNERVSFVFDPSGQSVRKALHVSPFMDMQNTWHLEAPEPTDRLHLVVRASHPVHGDYFYADLTARRSGQPHRLNEEAGLGALLRYGFMPHRVAALIYWQAIKLLVKGVSFCPPPSKAYQRKLVAEEGPTPAAGPAPVPAAPGKPISRTAPAAEVVAPAPHSSTTTTADDIMKGANNADGQGNRDSSSNGVGGMGLCPVGAAVWGARSHSHPRNGLTGQHFLWRPAAMWPWREG